MSDPHLEYTHHGDITGLLTATIAAAVALATAAAALTLALAGVL